jgi:hypothetical protein
MLTLHEHLSSTPFLYLGGVRVAHLFIFFVFRVPCCDVRYYFCMTTVFGSSLPPCLICVVCVYLRVLCFCLSSSCVPCVVFLFIFVLCALCCVFVYLRLVCPVLCFCLSSSCVPFVVFLFIFVLCALCCVFVY